MAKEKKQTISRWLFRSPRVLSIAFIAFLTMFSFDVFEMNLGFRASIGAFLAHSIPSFALTIILIISWKKELVGTVFYGIAGVAYIMMTILGSNLPWYIVLSWSMTIAGPTILIALLFFLNRRKKRIK